MIVVWIAVVNWLRDLSTGEDPTIGALLAQSQNANALMPGGLEHAGPASGSVSITGSNFTVRYRGDNWVAQSRYRREGD